MNVLLLSQFFSTTKGGGEYVFSMLAKMLVKNGHKVWIITHKIEDEHYDRDLNIIFVKPTIRYQGGLPPSFGDNIRYTINTMIAGSKIIRKNKIDIIHSNNFSPALAGSILSTLFSIPHVMTVHDIFSLCGKNYWKRWGDQANVSKINVMLAPFFEKMMIKLKHKCVHTVSDATREDLLKFGETGPIHVIHNSIESNQKIYEKRTSSIQFVYVGRLVFYKNLEVVIKAIEILKKTQPGIKLIIVGDGPHRRSLEDLVRKLNLSSNVEFVGYVSAERKLEIIASSNALVFPSLCEGFGLVILEAFSLGKPVLVSNIRPMSDIVNQRTGFVIDPYDEKAWAENISELIKNPTRALEMGENGKKVLLDSFGKESMYSKILEMYASCKRD